MDTAIHRAALPEADPATLLSAESVAARLVVLIDWADAYWTYHRGARIIVEASRPR